MCIPTLHGQAVDMDPPKLEAVHNWPLCSTLKQLQLFLGFDNFYFCFIQGYSLVVAPLMALPSSFTQMPPDILFSRWTPGMWVLAWSFWESSTPLRRRGLGTTGHQTTGSGGVASLAEGWQWAIHGLDSTHNRHERPCSSNHHKHQGQCSLTSTFTFMLHLANPGSSPHATLDPTESQPYQLHLPASLQIHPIFHTSQLKLFATSHLVRTTPTHPLPTSLTVVPLTWIGSSPGSQATSSTQISSRTTIAGSHIHRCK